MRSGRYSVRLTGAQLRVLHTVASVILNDEDWADTLGERDFRTLDRADDVLVEAWRKACRTEVAQ